MRSRAVEFLEAFIEAKAPNEKIAIGMFSRIIIIADEVDNESLGYTVDELKELIKEDTYPIDTIRMQNWQ